ncbi:unnamed protein product [Allacma fusca]|uniref:Uncharacterized protein n=1 Tax=Allacma fusca TaxID=39272 RepID=A0A8J2LAV4_9HEXA|nr:unnamed protein product [Allacma fusca]
MSSTQDQIEAALRSILASVGQQDPVYLQHLAEDVQQGRPNENQSRSSRFSRQPSSASESGERYNGAMSKGPVPRPYDDTTGLQGFSTVSQSLRNSMTSSDTTSAFAAAGNRMLSSSMSRTHNFSLPQISPLLKRRNTSTRSFVSKEPTRSEEFPIEIVFKSDSGCDSNDDHIRTHIRLCKEFSSDETSRELRFIDDLQPVPDGYVLALKKSKTIYVVIDEDEDSVGFQNNASPRVPVSSITCANEDVEDSVSVRTYGTPRALPSTAKNINTQHQYHSNEVPHHMRECFHLDEALTYTDERISSSILEDDISIKSYTKLPENKVKRLTLITLLKFFSGIEDEICPAKLKRKHFPVQNVRSHTTKKPN